MGGKGADNLLETSLNAIAGTIKAFDNIKKPLETMDADLQKNWNLENYPKL